MSARQCLPILLIALLPVLARAQVPPSYAREVRPFLAKYCLECHNATDAKGGLNMESLKALQQGGDSGPAFVPGKADDSRLVGMVEGKDEPRMPPKKAKRQPQAEEYAVLRAWVNAGAKDDSADVRTELPKIASKQKPLPAITAIAYLPNMHEILIGTQQGATSVSTTTKRESIRPFSNSVSTTKVTAIAVHPDAKGSIGIAAGLGEAGEASMLLCITPGTSEGFSPELPHADRIQALAFSHDGRYLLSCSYDRTLKLWDMQQTKELKLLREHSDAVYGVAIRPDGKLFASCSADRTVKVYDTATVKLLYTLNEATDWLYTLVWSPDGKHLAAAGVDKSIRVWQVDEKGGKVVHSVFAHEAPVLQLIYAKDGKTLYSLGEDRFVKAWDAERMVERKIYTRQPETVLCMALRGDQKELALGRYDGKLVLIDVATGKEEIIALKAIAPPAVDVAPQKRREQQPAPKAPEKPADPQEAEPNNSPGTGQALKLPATINGTLDKPGDLDCYRFEVKAGQQLGVRVTATGKPKTPLEPLLQLHDAQGTVLAESTQDHLGYVFAKAGSYALSLRDRDFRGDAEYKYKLELGEVPIVTSIFPLGVQRGVETTMHVKGVFLEGQHALKIKPAADAMPGSKLPLPLKTSKGTPLGVSSVVVGELPEVSNLKESVGQLAVPGTANGVIAQPGETNLWQFTAKKGQRLIVETHASRLGSQLDSYIEVLDAQQQPVPRAMLRSLARTYVTFRDHDSNTSSIRIEAWGELTVNDHILVGTELLKIRSLPTHPDADCVFFSSGGRRLGYLDTTPTHHAQGVPMYKVALHPPGSNFPPNGYPVVTLYYRNDDGGAGFERDSRIFFDPPADGTYLVRIGDSRGQGGDSCAYRLTVRPPRPSFNVKVTPTAPSVWRGGGVPVTVTAERIDGYAGPIQLRLENLPKGFSAPLTSIPAGEESTQFALWADASAAKPDEKAPPSKLSAEAMIEGKLVRKEVAVGLPKLAEGSEIATVTDQSEISVRPGGTVKLQVTIERKAGFTGRVPINVTGMPHGVKVLDIGLNGILITEKETTRTMVIWCEPWVEPIEHPIVVAAQREGKNTNHAAKSVLLKVVR